MINVTTIETLSYFNSLSRKWLTRLKKQDFILTPGRYVGIEKAKDDGEPFEEKMARLTTELYGLFEESHRLEEKIYKKLTAIGFGKEAL